MPQHVLIADDHPLFREALKLPLAQAVMDVKVHEADSVDSLFAVLESHRDIDLLLLDLDMPGAEGFSALVQSRAHFPTVPVVVVSGHEDEDTVARTIAYGASGFVPKSAPIQSIVLALRTVLDGGTWTNSRKQSIELQSSSRLLNHSEFEAAKRIATLTPQQFRVLSMVCSGLLNKQIAVELGVVETTVKSHMTAILEKLGAANRTHAVALAQRLAITQRTASGPGSV